MPSSTNGFSGQEVITFVQNWVGNQSAEFQGFLAAILPLAEMRFCKLYDWSFLHKTNLTLGVTSGTDTYSLNTSSVGYYVPSADIQQIWSVVNKIPFRKMTEQELRRLDPGESAGDASSKLVAWAPIDDNSIMFYPPNFSDTTVVISGKITPAPLLNLTNYPTIPYRYQESFLNYMISLALMRQNDDRFQIQKAETQAMIKSDIASDVGSSDDVLTPRIRSVNEQRFDGVSANLEALYNSWVWSTNSDY